MEYIVTKKYCSSRNGIKVETEIGSYRKITTPNTFFESDILQEMIDNFINNGILNFDIPVDVTVPENVPRQYLISVFSDVVTKYENGQPVTEKALTSHIEMSQEDKDLVDSLKWIEVKKDKNYKLIQTDRPVTIPEFGKNTVSYTETDIAIILVKKMLLRDIKTTYTDPFDSGLKDLLNWYDWGIEKEKIDYLK